MRTIITIGRVRLISAIFYSFTYITLIAAFILMFSVTSDLEAQVDGCAQISNINFAAAHPSQVEQPTDHSLGSIGQGSLVDGTPNYVIWGDPGNTVNPDNGVGKYYIETLELQSYACGDLVPFLIELVIDDNAACSDVTISLPV